MSTIGQGVTEIELQLGVENYKVANISEWVIKLCKGRNFGDNNNIGTVELIISIIRLKQKLVRSYFEEY